MKHFEYADEKITDKELMIAMPSVVIGVGILSMPKKIATETEAADGWIPLVVAGLLFLFMSWGFAKFVAQFPNQSFLEYSSRIIGRRASILIIIGYAILVVLGIASQVRGLADVAKEYLFDQTPIEVVGLLYVLLVIYAVCGSRAALFRMSMLFFPIVISITLIVLAFSMKEFELGNVMPAFTTDTKGYFEAMKSSIRSYIGFGIILFYMVLVKRPAKAPKMVAIGMVIPIVVYILLYVVIIGIFGNAITSNLIYPTVELAKNVSIPGEFLERFESIFFVIWIMATFTSSILFLDAGVYGLTSILGNNRKIPIVLILSPLIYFVSMVPEELQYVQLFGMVWGYSLLIYTLSVVSILMIVAKIRGMI
ncbi:GerAB/ArcD/ProY family transporter [Lentibacillus saliphilus]|uniref:GerAB/ArcD/ProY family transporter n=1 Tax=Lentibacillus saliphilus TaxID=2737028 RepID=UPI001C305CA2|nr:endospore germination permease [Lentibacillus saliphilus]